MHKMRYQSPIGNILITADEIGITELEFIGDCAYQEGECTPILEETKKWLDIYFSGKNPNFSPQLHIDGSDFQLLVWDICQTIPFGETTTYGKIAEIIAKYRGISKMSSQAVGGALGRNKIPIIIPCHRVIGIKGSLIGYTGGIDKKIKLLNHEAWASSQFVGQV